MPIIKNCELCQDPFPSKPSENKRFCDKECYEKFRIFKRLYVCDYCNTMFLVEKEAYRKPSERNFCDHACQGKWQTGANNHAWEGVKETKNCKVCNGKFEVKHTDRKNQETCSLKCRDILKVERNKLIKIPVYDNCKYCNKQIEIRNCEIGKRNFCNRECANKGHSLYIRGENNGRYINGAANAGYPSDWNKRFKTLIRQRDGNICKLCNMTEEEHGKLLNVHHIDGVKENLDEMNLITLCRFCHGKMHGKGNKREEWKEKLLNLLSLSQQSLTMSIT